MFQIIKRLIASIFGDKNAKPVEKRSADQRFAGTVGKSFGSCDDLFK